MANWFHDAEDALAAALNNGEITKDEFHAAMKDLRAEMRLAAEEAAQEAYDREMGGW